MEQRTFLGLMVEWLQSPACHVGGTGSNPVGTAYKDTYSKSLFNHQTFNPETINFLYPEHLRWWHDWEATDSKSVIWGFESLTARSNGAELV